MFILTGAPVFVSESLAQPFILIFQAFILISKALHFLKALSSVPAREPRAIEIDKKARDKQRNGECG